MTKPITVPNTFATQNGPIPLSQLDVDFSTAYGAINDPSTYNNYLIDSGSTGNIIVSFAGGLSYTKYSTGDRVCIKVASTSNGATTININSLGAKNVKTPAGGNITQNQMVSGGVYEFVYDGTNFQLVTGIDPSLTSTITGTPTFTGLVQFQPTSTQGIQVQGASGAAGVGITGNLATGNSFGITCSAGTNTTDYSASFSSRAGVVMLQCRGDGLVRVNETILGPNQFNLQTAATYESGSFTGTFTGMTSATTGTINWARTGNIVVLWLVNDISGTSNSTAMTITGLPSGLTPATTKNVVSTAINNTVANVLTLVQIGSNSVITFLLASNAAPQSFAAGNFTAAGTKGWNGNSSITYSLQ